jgi:GntR family transcriptional regulator/MocR family aminotransferase
VGIDILGLSALHAANDPQAGFLMGFAAYTPAEIEVAVRRLAEAFRTITRE